MLDLYLDTERLELYPFIPEDTEDFQLMNNDPYVRKFLWDDEKIDAMMADDIMGKNLSHFEENKFGLWKLVLKKNRVVIGYVGLWYFFDEPQPQLVYALLEPYTRQGFATEASRSIIDYAFDQLGYDYLIAATDELHVASQKVAERLGMSLVEKKTKENKSTLFYRIDKVNITI